MSEIVLPASADTADAQRRGHRVALETAALILGISPIVPTHITSECPSYAAGGPTVNVYFHRSHNGVQQLAHALGAEASARPFGDDDPRPYIELTAAVRGISVHAWTLLEADDEASGPTAAESAERLRAVLAPSAAGGRP